MADTARQECSEKVMRLRAEALVAALKMAQAEQSLAEHDEGPVAARWLAQHLGLHTTNAETLRRRVREAADYARKHGHMVCANGAGYWLARSVAEYARYEASRKSGAKFEFVAQKQRQRAVSERNTRQGVLFNAQPIPRF